MKLETLQDLFLDQLSDLYSAENQIVKALPKMVDASSSPELQRGFEEHLEQTRHQIDRLKQIFEGLNLYSVHSKTCKGMEGILHEGKEYLGGIPDPKVRDAGLIAAAQRVEHYEISGYGTARTMANRLGYTSAAELLQQTLEEEKATDIKLTTIAEQRINTQDQIAN
jgi:Uncharacterized protein conserved in bacteria